MKSNSLNELRRKTLRELRAIGSKRSLIDHSTEVADLALKIAGIVRRNGNRVCLSDVLIGAVFHDVGYVRVSGIRHGLAGAQIVRELGYSEEIAQTVENHILGGINKRIITSAGLDLPARDFLPQTLEAKIVAFADQVVHRRSDSGVFLIEDRRMDVAVATQMYRLYDEVLGYMFLPKKAAKRCPFPSKDGKPLRDQHIKSSDLAIPANS